jgi:hypothetical protein
LFFGRAAQHDMTNVSARPKGVSAKFGGAETAAHIKSLVDQ